MNVLHVMQTVDPAYGGPVEVLIRSNPAWRRLGHSREIVSLDLPGDPWTAACPITTHAVGSRAVRRWRRQVPLLRYGFTPTLVPWLRRNAAAFDAVIVHGLWNYTGLAARRVLPSLAKPYFVFTHGMLDPWFRTAYPAKHFAKRLVWLLADGPLLRGARAVLCTSEGERAEADHVFRPERLAWATAGYGVADPPPASAAQNAAFRLSVPDLRGRYLLFLGRLHQKKGCDLLIRAFASLATTHPQLDLVVAGPDPQGLRPGLSTIAERAGVGHRVHWSGMLTGDAKWGALRGCEAFVLPSHGENFGVAVVEAMACGRPVIISDRVNIGSVVAVAGAGLVGPDTASGTERMLRDLLALAPADRAAMGQSARRCYEDNYDIDRVMVRTADLLATAATQ